MANYYEILNVDSNATPEEIKDAYRIMAMKWHPDRNPSRIDVALEKFKEISAAYKILSNPVSRKEYDQKLLLKEQYEHSYDSEPKMSSDDANLMFFESMLDLASELAKRGYAEIEIAKVLISLDCPEKLAKVVAKNAEKNFKTGNRNETKSNKQSASAQPLKSVAGAKWHEIKPYYEAVIGGVYADVRMTDDEYSKQLDKDKKTKKWYLIFFGLMVTGIVISAKISFESIGAFIFFTGLLGVIGVAIWRMFSNDRLFNREKTMRYFLSAFESYHNARPLPMRFKSFNLWGYLFHVYWLAYRKMYGYASLLLFIFFIISMATLFLTNNIQEMPVINLIYFLPAIALGVIANKLYFKSASGRIEKHIHLTQENALAQLRNSGGVNAWAWILFLLLFMVLNIPYFIKANEVKKQKIALQAQEQAESITKQNAINAKVENEKNQLKAEENKKLDAAINDLESRYPELSDQSPKFNQKIVDEVLSRQKVYIQQGQPPSTALRSAVADMTQPASPAQNNH